MLKMKKTFLYLLAAISLVHVSSYASNTWMLDDEQNWDLIATDEQKKFVENMTFAQKLVNDGNTKDAKSEFAAIKKNFSELSGKDFDLFVKSEILLSNRKLVKSARSFEKLLTKYSESILRDMAIKREYEIGINFLNGRKKVVLGFIAIKGNTEGISILEKMIDHAGVDSPIAIESSVAIAKNYEKRKKFDEAYLKWYEIYSLVKSNSILKRDALYEMAKAKHASYNKNPESKKPFYDSTTLRAAKSYYEMLKSYYPEYADEIGVDDTLKVIIEQLAYKELSIGLYYQKMGNIQSANLYFDMVISNWPDSKSAEIAQNMLKENTES